MLVRAENFLLAGDASTAAYPAAPDYFIDDDGRRSAPHEDNINRITHAGIVAGAPSGLSDPVTDPFTGEVIDRSEEHTSELQSLMRISYAVFCLKKKTNNQ